jgi:hypothetical protein
VWDEWQASRIDVDPRTSLNYRTSKRRIPSVVGDIAVEAIDVSWVTRTIEALREGGGASESIRKTRFHLATVLDFAEVDPNPARDRRVRVPRRVFDGYELTPPAARHVEAVFYALAPRYRLPTLVYDASGMRLS